MTRRSVVLTGASSGIGHATALAFARGGAKLTLVARGRAGLEEVAAHCRKLGGDVLIAEADVADADAVNAVADRAIERFGRIDVWVNNVGVGVVGRFDTTPMQAHRRVIEANLIGHMNGAHAALGHFRRHGHGTLVNMISVSGWASAPYAAAYTASKFALRGFSESLRAEVSALPDVHVCEIYPTFVDTPAMAHGANYTGRRLKPPPPLLDPRKVANSVVSVVDTPRAKVSVGSVAWPARMAHAVAPDLVGRLARVLMDTAFRRAHRARITSGNLFEPSVGTLIDGGHRIARAPWVAGTMAVGTACVVGWLIWKARQGPTS